MAATINADNGAVSGSAGLKSSADSSGVLALQTNGTTAVTVDASQNVGVGVAPVEKLQSNKGIAASGANQSVGSLDGFVADYSSGNSRLFASRNGVASSTMQFWTTDSGGAAAERARFNSTGAFVLAGGTTTANGTGITFPATQSASTDANTLDDYEEGTWTPVLRGSGTAGNFNQATSTGKYTKIGNMVTLYCAITGGSVTGSPTGDLQITGLPFACAAGTSASGAAQTQYLGITQVPVVSFSTRGTSSILYLAYVNGSQVGVLVQASAVGSSAIVDFCISYPT